MQELGNGVHYKNGIFFTSKPNFPGLVTSIFVKLFILVKNTAQPKIL